MSETLPRGSGDPGRTSGGVRLVGAVLAEQHDEGAVVRGYLTVDGMLKPVPVSLPAPDPKETKSKRAA
jgi:hypothetical protein